MPPCARHKGAAAGCTPTLRLTLCLTLSSHSTSPLGHTALTTNVLVTLAVSPALLVALYVSVYSPGRVMSTPHASSTGTARAEETSGRHLQAHTVHAAHVVGP